MRKVARLLGSADGARVLAKIAGGKVGAVERPLIEEIVQRAHQKVARSLLDGEQGDAEEANRKAEQLARSFLKPLRARRALLGTMKPLAIPAAKAGPQSFHCWLGNGVSVLELAGGCARQKSAKADPCMAVTGGDWAAAHARSAPSAEAAWERDPAPCVWRAATRRATTSS